MEVVLIYGYRPTFIPQKKFYNVPFFRVIKSGDDYLSAVFLSLP
jgi:hypothetical protein